MHEATQRGRDQRFDMRESEPIQCYAYEFTVGNEVYQIHLESHDPRFKLVQKIYSEMHPGGHGMSITTDKFRGTNGLPLEQARKYMQRVIDYVAQPGFLKELLSQYRGYVTLQEQVEVLSEQVDALGTQVEIVEDHLRELLPEFPTRSPWLEE